MRILMVEDNCQMRRLLKSMLAGLVSEFYECSDGAEALAA
jgi:CheY-like chemotaxis protein